MLALPSGLDAPYHQMMDDTGQQPPPPHWIEALDRAEADLAAGRLIDGETVHRKLREAIARMEARQAEGEPPRRAAL